jgi:tryptophan synthase alpha subunit
MVAGAERIAAAFAGSGKSAALMPYLMGGFPTLEGSRRIGEAYADGGADLVELGVPYSDPLADGPVIAAAGARALRAGSTLDGVLGSASTSRRGFPWCSCATRTSSTPAARSASSTRSRAPAARA